MNFGKYDTYKRCFYFMIFNELSCIVQGNNLLMIKNTMNMITILQPSNLNVFYMITFKSEGLSYSENLLSDSLLDLNFYKVKRVYFATYYRKIEIVRNLENFLNFFIPF